MAANGLERFNQRPGRPPIASQHSSSVPSTPHQHPRDIRFPSRSPSPSRGLGSHSPQSVASEAVGGTHPASLRAGQGQAQVVCKFETGAEFKKRRIAYIEGGNEPLPPPEKEPKKTLEPHEDERLSGDMRELYDRLLPTEESEQRRSELVKKLENIFNTEWPGNDIKVNVFGSTGNLLSSNDSDVDICITTPFKKLESMHMLATVLHKHGMERVICRAAARVPIVKCWDPELQLACDMNVNNPLALENTRMIRTYVQIDERVRPVAKIIKYWTNQRILNDAAFGGTISSYTWICMIINFLQQRQPPILPSLQKLPDSQKSMVQDHRSPFADDLESLRGYGAANKETIGQLLFHFFRFYGYEIDYNESVISVKEGRLLSRKEKGWDSTNYMDKEARSRLCVEEPFNNFRNLGNSADDYAFSGIHQEIRRAFELIAEGNNLAECCEQYVFPPEEKPIFQRPPPKPKPVLTRSASQSGKGNSNSNQGRGQNNGPRNNRNTSSHRNNNRRASSGASYNNQRGYGYVQSPPIQMNAADYFDKDQLHNQLYKQYQYLQQQQEALRNQLMQQMQAHAQAQVQAQVQAQARGIDPNLSPRQRPFANSLPSPRVGDSSTNGTSILPPQPGYLYHYPARYPPPSPLSQTRTTEGTSTNPSSPSLTASVPALRRGSHRSSVTDTTSSGSVRSQSQPGRSFPNPLALQGMAHPGYDVSGAIGTPYFARPMMYAPVQTNGTVSTTTMGPHGPMAMETAMPKEYVGYYVGQSPQLVPQYPSGGISQIPPFRESPQHHRRDSPELMPPMLPNGLRHQSRSPSPLGHGRSYSSSTNPPMSAPLPQTQFPVPAPIPKRSEEQGPIIVNGSNAGQVPVTPVVGSYDGQQTHGLGVHTTPPAVQGDISTVMPTPIANGTTHYADSASISKGSPLQLIQTGQDFPVPQWESTVIAPDTTLSPEYNASPSVSPANHGRPAPPRLNLSPNGTSMTSVSSTSTTGSEHIPDISPLTTAPLLSPVAELRTPSPTSSRGVDSPKGDLARTAQIANGKLAEHEDKGRPVVAKTPAKKEMLKENTCKAKAAPAPGTDGGKSYPGHAQQGKEWQPAPGRKTHKKNKSSVGRNGNGAPKSGGEPMPLNEADRKGG